MVKAAGPFSALLGFACLVSVAAAGERVSAELIANVSSIQAGKPFWAGVKYTIAPGYHIYWKNPGDSGLATEVKLNLREGFTAGEILFPVPDRLQLPGDIVNYAYEKQVMLLVQITPPRDLPVGQSISLSASTNWLVCKDDCTPGSAKVSLQLPVAGAASSANEELFKTWSSRLPVDKDPTDIASIAHSMTVTNGGGTGNIKIGWKNVPTDIQFLPGLLKNGEIDTITIMSAGNETKITFDVKNHSESETVTGLVTFTNAAGVRTGLDVSIPGTMPPSNVPPNAN